MVIEDYMILGFSFLLAAICALANLVSKEFKRQENVIAQLETELQKLKPMNKKGVK